MNVRQGLFAVLFAIASASASVTAHATGVTPGQETPVQRFQAEQRFLRGKQLYQQGKYDEALVELRASLDIVQSPNTRLLIARCLRDKGNIVAAYVEFGRASVAAKELAAIDARYASAAKGADDDRAALEQKIGFVTVTVQNATDDTKLIVGGEEIRRAAWVEPAPVAPGTTEISVETPGHEPVKKTVTVGAKQRAAITIDAATGASTTGATEPVTPPPPPEPPPSSDRTSLRPWAYVAGGVGLVGLLTFAIEGSAANSTYSDLKSACPNGRCPPTESSVISSGKTKQTIANIGLVVGILGVAGGVTLFVLSQSKTEEPPRAAVMVGPAWIGVGGTL
jgi:hypothetical protein